MVYDFDDCENKEPPIVTNHIADPKSFDCISIMLDLAAIWLTDKPGDTFTFEQLFNQAQELGGEEIVLDEEDVKLVFVISPHFQKEKDGLYSLK